jgi:hypothetical protein
MTKNNAWMVGPSGRTADFLNLNSRPFWRRATMTRRERVGVGEPEMRLRRDLFGERLLDGGERCADQ